MTRRQFVVKAALALILPAAIHASSEPVPRIDRAQVSSSSLASVGYDPAAALLEIEFLSGAVYRYADVPDRVYRALMAAESKGRYFSQHIRGHYRFRRTSEGGR